jgi:F-type H+-transporting ATPase subunit delta
MPNPRLAYRYAKSLLDLAIEKDMVESIYTDMQWLNAVCKSNRDFVNVLKSPVINVDLKKKVIEAVTDGNISATTTLFNKLLVTKGREQFLPEITTAFISAYKEYKHIKIVKLTSASEISDTVKEAIINSVRESMGFEKIELDAKVDPSLIGGFVLQIDDKLVDASIIYDLRTIAKQFQNNDFIYKIR